jgi:inorganic pyrophosphatase
MPIANLWRELPPGPDAPRVIYVVVEIPKRSRNKYEYDEQGGFIKLDRVLYSSLHYPGDYGFIPRTLHEDGDPLDVLVMTNEPTFSGCVIEARPLGIFHLLDRGRTFYDVAFVKLW